MISRHAIPGAIEKLEVKRLFLNISNLCLANISALVRKHLGIEPGTNADTHSRRWQLPEHLPALTKVPKKELQYIFTMNITLQKSTIIQT
jgi:hypothetical protein